MFLALLEQFTSEGRNASANPGSTYAPKLFSEHPAAEGVTKLGFKRAMNNLLARQRKSISKWEGPPSRRRSLLVRWVRGPEAEADGEDCDMDELATHAWGRSMMRANCSDDRARIGSVGPVGRWPEGGRGGRFPTPFQPLSTPRNRASNPVQSSPPNPVPTPFHPPAFHPLYSKEYRPAPSWGRGPVFDEGRRPARNQGLRPWMGFVLSHPKASMRTHVMECP